MQKCFSKLKTSLNSPELRDPDRAGNSTTAASCTTAGKLQSHSDIHGKWRGRESTEKYKHMILVLEGLKIGLGSKQNLPAGSDDQGSLRSH